MRTRRRSSEGGFIYIETLFVVMILSVSAMLVMSGMHEAQMLNKISAVRTAALFVGDAQTAELRYLASTGNLELTHYDYLGAQSDLKFEHFMGGDDDGMTLEFEVTADYKSDDRWEVKVTPTVNGEPWDELKFERVIINRFPESTPEPESTD